MHASQENNRPRPSDRDIRVSIEQLAIKHLDLHPDRLKNGLRLEDSLVTALELDSVTRLELLFEIEETYGITLEFEDGIKLDTVGDLVGVIQKHLSANPSSAQFRHD